MTNLSRRAVLGTIGTAATLGFAGCMGGGDDDTASGIPLSDHPLGENLGDWPHLGSDPFEAPATLVVLDDPSCSRCAVFHKDTVTQLESDYAAADELSIAVRPYPVVYQWGEPAAHLLEATALRDESAFWDLLNHYFTQQSSFGPENVTDRTETWLAENTDLDAAAVVADADSEAATGRIDATLSAGEEAGAGSTTPVTYAFVDGELQTSLNGSVSTDTIETALQL